MGKKILRHVEQHGRIDQIVEQTLHNPPDAIQTVQLGATQNKRPEPPPSRCRVVETFIDIQAIKMVFRHPHTTGKPFEVIHGNRLVSIDNPAECS
ncbi:hypothetical protein D3C73_1184300 [compost metagenome]